MNDLQVGDVIINSRNILRGAKIERIREEYIDVKDIQYLTTRDYVRDGVWAKENIRLANNKEVHLYERLSSR